VVEFLESFCILLVEWNDSSVGRTSRSFAFNARANVANGIHTINLL
jgi:hypothetical protein